MNSPRSQVTQPVEEGRSGTIFARTLLALLMVLQVPLAMADGSYLVNDLGTLGRDSHAWGVNNLGQVVGESQLSSPPFFWHAFIHDGTTMQDLGSLTHSLASRGWKINDSGQVVGFAYADTAPSTVGARAFLFSGGTVITLSSFGGVGEECGELSFSPVMAMGINNAGQVVGWAYAGAEFCQPGRHAFLYSAGGMSDLGTLGSFSARSYAYGINDSGHVAGYSQIGDLSPAYHAFLYSGGTMHDLGTLGGTNSYAFGINASDQVVGYSQIAADTAEHAILYSGGAMHDLGTLGGTNSYAYDINDSGQIVGYSQVAGDSAYHAFLYSGGTMHDLNDLIPSSFGSVLTTARDISGTGHIASVSLTPDGSQRACLLTPGAYVTAGMTGPISVGLAVTLTFSSVLSAGTVTALLVPGTPLAPPNFYVVGGTEYSITSEPNSGFFDGQVQVCIDYDPSKISVPDPQMLRLWHKSGDTWNDITQLPVDTVNNRVCGLTSSFSIFAVAEPTDVDGDGIFDDKDKCPHSDLSANIVIDGCYPGVANILLANGCTIIDSIAKCNVGVGNHGQFVSCVSDLTNGLKKAGTISGQQKGAIQSCAAKAHSP